jgi:hypothetical protein
MWPSPELGCCITEKTGLGVSMYSRYSTLLNLIEGIYAILRAANVKYAKKFYIEIYRRLLVSSSNSIRN